MLSSFRTGASDFGAIKGETGLEISKERKERLKRYFINADPFLWGVLESKNKKGRLEELKRLGFLKGYSEGGNPIYNRINQDLLVESGIEGILERIVIPRVTAQFSSEVLGYFRRCWECCCQGKMSGLLISDFVSGIILTDSCLSH